MVWLIVVIARLLCCCLFNLPHLMAITESEEDYNDLTESIRLVKEVIAAVDSKVNEHEKKRRLKEFHIRMDSKSIMMMKNGHVFAREDMLRRRLIHDGVLQLKNSQGRLKGKKTLTDFITAHELTANSFFLTVCQCCLEM